MMPCSIIDDHAIVEGGRPNQIAGPDHDHGQLGNARTGPHALRINAPSALSRRTSRAHGDLGTERLSQMPRPATLTKLGVVNLIPVPSIYSVRLVSVDFRPV
jgi:hypothetical protein